MKLSKDDLLHIHKVLQSDRDECEILAKDMTGGRFERILARRDDDKRVLTVVEEELGYIPAWEYVPVEEEEKKEENHE